MLNQTIDHESGLEQPSPEDISVRTEGAVLFAGIASQRIGALSSERARVLASLIQAGADGSLRVVAFKRASRISTTMERGFHAREAEMDQMLRILDCDV